MDIMKIFTILLIITIVILGFNLIKVEPFQYDNLYGGGPVPVHGVSGQDAVSFGGSDGPPIYNPSEQYIATNTPGIEPLTGDTRYMPSQGGQGGQGSQGGQGGQGGQGSQGGQGGGSGPAHVFSGIGAVSFGGSDGPPTPPFGNMAVSNSGTPISNPFNQYIATNTPGVMPMVDPGSQNGPVGAGAGGGEGGPGGAMDPGALMGTNIKHVSGSTKEECELGGGVWTQSILPNGTVEEYCGEAAYVPKENQCYDILVETDCKEKCQWVDGYCEDSTACTTMSKSQSVEACETPDGLCEWNDEMSMCGEKDSCGSPSRRENDAVCESDGKCKWIQLEEGSKGFCGELPGKLPGSVEAAAEAAAEAEAAVTTAANPKTYCGFDDYDITDFNYEKCHTECKQTNDEDEECDNNECCDDRECDKLCNWYQRQSVIDKARNNSFKQIDTLINKEQDELDKLQSELPDNIGALLDKEEYLLRALDSMRTQEFPKEEDDTEKCVGSICCDKIFSDINYPTKIISKFNRNKLYLNYLSTPLDDTGKELKNTCIVTINLNKNNNDKINKLVVGQDDNDNLYLDSDLNSDCNDDLCGHFILRKICDKKQYVDLYDQYTTKYFVADPNIDYSDLYILQPYNYPYYSLQVDTQSNSDVLLLNNLSGNKNEQFEKIFD
jgi:hypothetical protein